MIDPIGPQPHPAADHPLGSFVAGFVLVASVPLVLWAVTNPLPVLAALVGASVVTGARRYASYRDGGSDDATGDGGTDEQCCGPRRTDPVAR